MTIREVLNHAEKKLAKYSASSQLDAEVLLSHVLDKPKEYIYSNPEKQIRPIQEKKYSKLISRRQLGWPVAYLTGEKEFFGRKFFITRDVLVPRPETETLVELILEKLKTENRKLKIIDIGTGSGNIIISLVKNLRNSPPREGELEGVIATRPPLAPPQEEGNFYFASDISQKALALAKQNAKLHKVKITFRQGSLLAPWKGQKFDIIVANLPYLTRLEHPSTKFEPKTALLTGNSGLALYEKLFKQVLFFSPPLDPFGSTQGHLERSRNGEGEIKRGSRKDRSSTTSPNQPPAAGEGGSFSSRGGGLAIFIEFDPRQTRSLKLMIKKNLPKAETKFYKDLSGKNRFAEIKTAA